MGKVARKIAPEGTLAGSDEDPGRGDSRRREEGLHAPERTLPHLYGGKHRGNQGVYVGGGRLEGWSVHVYTTVEREIIPIVISD